MNLVCKICGKDFYLSEQDPIPNLEDLYCDDCNGELIEDEDLDDIFQ